MEVFLVRVKSETYAIPLLDVYRHERIERSQIKTVGSKEVLELVDEEEIIPLLRISEIFDLPEHKTEQTKQSRFSGPAERSEPIYVVVVVSSGRKVGLVVDAIIGQQEIVIKPLCESIGKVPGIAGATILGNGDVVLIIDVSFLVLPETHFLSETRFLKENGFLIRNWNDERLDESRKHKILVFELNEQEYGIDVSYVKTINPLTKITHVPKTPPCLLGVMNLHGRIIPVVDLYRRFDIEESHKAKMFVIVVLVDGKEIGLLVDRASDVRNVAFDEILPPPPDAISVDVTYIDGIFQLKSEKQRKMIILLNLEQIFRNPFPQRKRVSANF
jgi:chemotaxis protein histidine kinase CheA